MENRENERDFKKIDSTHNGRNVDDRRVLQAQLDDLPHNDLTHIYHGFVIHRKNPGEDKELNIS